MTRHPLLALIALSLSTLLATPSQANTALPISLDVTPPPIAAEDLCNRKPWACARRSAGVDARYLDTIRTVTRQVHRDVRQILDRQQYRVEDHWALPTARGGDCEDLALETMRRLQALNFPAGALRIATVLDKNRNGHAVLVIRIDGADVVADPTLGWVKEWRDTGYTFIRIQNADSSTGWSGVLAGGILK